jgi:hypothetical protein
MSKQYTGVSYLMQEMYYKRCTILHEIMQSKNIFLYLLTY